MSELGKPKKGSFFSGPAIKRGEGKYLFLKLEKKKSTKVGGGGKALVAGPLKKDPFFGFP